MTSPKRFDIPGSAAATERAGSPGDTIVCRNYLRLIDAIPSEVEWNVVAIHLHVLVADSREDATSVIMEAVACQFGTVVAVESIPSQRRGRGPLLGCLISVPGKACDVEGRLRAAYWQATEPCGNGHHQPF